MNCSVGKTKAPSGGPGGRWPWGTESCKKKQRRAAPRTVLKTYQKQSSSGQLWAVSTRFASALRISGILAGARSPSSNTPDCHSNRADCKTWDKSGDDIRVRSGSIAMHYSSREGKRLTRRSANMMV